MKTAFVISLMIFLAAAQRPVTPDSGSIILAFGDSLTAGYGVQRGSGYPERLQKKLEALGYKYRVVSMGVNGDTTAGGLSRLGAGLAVKPSIVILELGANDGLRGLPTARTQANLEEMIAAFQKAGAKVILAGMTLPKNYGAAYVRTFDDVFRDAAKQYNATFIPFFPFATSNSRAPPVLVLRISSRRTSLEYLRSLIATSFIPGPIPAFAATISGRTSMMAPSGFNLRPREKATLVFCRTCSLARCASESRSVYESRYPPASIPPSGARSVPAALMRVSKKPFQSYGATPFRVSVKLSSVYGFTCCGP